MFFLLESSYQKPVDIFIQTAYQVESYNSSFTETKLISMVKDIHNLGICSITETKLSVNLLKCAKNLIAVNCFCIGNKQY